LLRSWLWGDGCEWIDEVGFNSWIGKAEEEGEILNGVQIVLEAWSYVIKG